MPLMRKSSRGKKTGQKLNGGGGGLRRIRNPSGQTQKKTVLDRGRSKQMLRRGLSAKRGGST